MRRSRHVELVFLGALFAGCGERAVEVSNGDAPRAVASAAAPMLPADRLEAKPAGAVIPAVHATLPAQATPAQAAGSCPAGMVLVRGGSFERLSDGSRAEVGDACLDEYEVTVDAFAASVARGAVERSGCDGACPAVPKRTAWGDPSEDWNASKYCNGTRADRGNHPVNCVSVEEAIAHCNARGARLPTSTEWEWAARGADRLATPWGSPVAKGEICWGKPKKRDGTCAVGSLKKDTTNDGVYDLGGNVSEWTVGPSGPLSRVRHAQGASWYAIDDGYARAALGGFDTPAQRAETIGFRCAADVAR